MKASAQLDLDDRNYSEYGFRSSRETAWESAALCDRTRKKHDSTREQNRVEWQWNGVHD
jgi:hypothetical protein